MDRKFINKASILWSIIEFICVIVFSFIEIRKYNLSIILIKTLGIFVITLLSLLMLSFQIWQTWLNIGEGIGKIVNGFWLLCSFIGILWILTNLFMGKKEIVIVLPLLIAVFFTTIYWKRYMDENDPKKIKTERAKRKEIRDKEKIRI